MYIIIINVNNRLFYRSNCPELSPPQYARLTCTEGIRIGSQCRTTCLEGYKINGAESTDCLINKNWSSRLPTCDLVRCPRLQVDLSPHLRMDCTEGNIYRSSCRFSCEIGRFSTYFTFFRKLYQIDY
jgi:hypothetical protein